MKRLLTIVAFLGFSLGCYAQNTQCTCSAKKGPHKPHKKIATTTGKVVKTGVKKSVVHKAATPLARKNEKNCPDAGSMNQSSSKSFTGYYPENNYVPSPVPPARESWFMQYLTPAGDNTPSTDPNYYFHLNDGKCRWWCEPGGDHLKKEVTQ